MADQDNHHVVKGRNGGAGDPRAAAEHIVHGLQAAGHIAYFAGGCVRDMLRDAEPTDYDVATDATPDRVRELFIRAREVGEAFGVMLVRACECEIEVATFRQEWGYADGRHPDHVEFTDAAHDAARRDFTINGMFYDPVADEVHDFVGGRDDLAANVIRAIGDPVARFGEDYLRMLRAVRFASRLGYVIEPATRDAIIQHAGKLTGISRERIGDEVRRMLSVAERHEAAEHLQAFGLDGPAFSEDSRKALLICLKALAPDADYATGLAAWLLDRALPTEPFENITLLIDALRRIKVVQQVRRWRKALVLSNDESETLIVLLNDLSRMLGWDGLPIAQRKRLMAKPHWNQLVCLLHAVLARCADAAFDLPTFEEEMQSLRQEGVAPEPLANGDDLIAVGLQPGPAFKHILDETYDAQLEGQVTTREQAIAFAQQVAGQM